ncbi:MAG: Na/Pi cotransporter family protein [Syntrophales bacterium]|jgi:phosphate:Na+ symporter|nr:Na/Pi cotransporter family protein [Syntrophales bacterium]MCK9527899.1 Na/Pi cotransporter family protein [Syntrophales bacterium]MDX9921926.1 Na/Pi cotransporter family protein [Syntrophales bacterium]
MYAEVIAGVVGGLGLFLFGIHLMSNSLKALSLGLFRDLLEKITSNRVKSAFLGAIVTSLVQSSSAVSVILIGFLNAGMLTLVAALPVIFGANIGTTLTAQLIAFKLTKSAFVIVFAGAMIHLFARKEKTKKKALALLGFGILFLGLALMGSSVKPLAENDTMIRFFLSFGTYPLLGVLTGIIITVILQSSSTTVGIVIAFASAGLLDLPASVYLVFGDNIGTCITALIASIGGRRASKRLALGHTLFNIIGTAIALPMIPLYLHCMPILSGDIARQIANTHTIFNVFNTIIMLPFVPFFVTLLEKLVPGEDYEKKEGGFLEPSLMSTPALAIGASIRELSVMLSVCRDMLQKTRECIESYSHKLRSEIMVDESSVDDMQKKITSYLVGITQAGLSDKQRRLVPAILHSVNDVEKVGDYCEDIVNLSQRLYEKDLSFSSQAQAEMGRLFDKTEALMKHTKQALDRNDERAARITLIIEREIDVLIDQYKLNHLKRMEEGSCIQNAGLVFSDILTNIERISNHLCNITKGILHRGKR